MDKNVDDELSYQNTSNKKQEKIISTSNPNNAHNINDNSPEQNDINIQNLNNINNPENISNSSPNSCPGKVITINSHTKNNNDNNNKSNKETAKNKILNNPNSKLLQEKLKNIFLEREKRNLNIINN